MYAEFFGLRELPFNNTPDPRFFYPTPDHEEALASLIYAVKEKKGFVLLTGEVGAGKTLVSRLMIKHFAGTIAFANINHAIRDSADLTESLCAEFELVHEKDASNAQLVRMLHDFLLAKFAQNIPVVLVLDEAQNLSVDAFEQLRMIGNLEADDAKLLQIAIVGQPELQTRFQSAALRQLRQRLFRSFHLPALDRQAAEGYIRHRLTVAGARDPAMFGPRSIDAIHKASRGLPRLINTLCDNVMLSAYSADRKTLDTAFVESVLAAIMVSEPAGTTTSPNVPQRVVTQQTTRHVSQAQRQTYHSQDPLSAACAQAAALIAQMETGLRHSEVVAERLTATTDRAAHNHQQLLHREQQLTSLLHMVKSSAAHLAPLLSKMNDAARIGARHTENAQTMLRRLDDQTAKSQNILDRMADAAHRVRLAEMQAPSLSLRSSVDDPAPPTPRRISEKPATSNASTPSAALLREAQLASSSVVPVDHSDEMTDPSRPALRLARRMENLAALVHQAVTACTPSLTHS